MEQKFEIIVVFDHSDKTDEKEMHSILVDHFVDFISFDHVKVKEIKQTKFSPIALWLLFSLFILELSLSGGTKNNGS